MVSDDAMIRWAMSMSIVSPKRRKETFRFRPISVVPNHRYE